MQITQDQVSDFSKDISKFKESFINEGPCSIGVDLDAGILTTVTLSANIYDTK